LKTSRSTEPRSALVLQHADFEGPARIGDLLSARGFAIETRALHRGEAVPETMRPEDVLVVMGGPMGVGDVDRPGLSFLRDELRLLRRRIEEDAPVLGICLGAQLLAAAAGARVYPMRERGPNAIAYEVGWGPVRFHPEALASLGHVPGGLDALEGSAHVLHWHGDTFDLPPGAKLLASSDACQNQGFRLGRRLFGLQFHCEVDEPHVEAFLQADADFVIKANGPGGVEELRAETRERIGPARKVGDALLGSMLETMASPR
jgi:GMP synthase (glutamine-hydrolysing)